MPQMAPISWLTLFILFSMTFMIFNILNYYCFFNNPSENKTSEKFINQNLNNLNWKW